MSGPTPAAVTASTPVRIAMWSGPRNISTAMMRSFGNRPDTVVVDEPLYAAYLRATGLDHPGREEILASQDGDWRSVTAALVGPVPGSRPVFYQKHMTHHLLPETGRGWLGGVTNTFLVRDPAEVVASYARVRGDPTLEDLGFPQQMEIFRACADLTGLAPIVVDAADVLADPRGLLTVLCERLGIGFDDAMLSWPAGPRPTDGVWATHWYASVERSTGFGSASTTRPEVPQRLLGLLERCRPYYDELRGRRITAAGLPS
jgi:Sulfotransferase domain